MTAGNTNVNSSSPVDIFSIGGKIILMNLYKCELDFELMK
jgi:hypothetical protein